MSTFVHASASTIAGDLEPTGPVPNADSGDPQASVLRFDTDDSLRAGIWECQPGGWSVENREATETCYILSGHAFITNAATAERFEITAGDVFVLPKGSSYRWDVTETIRKFFTVGG
jgi:uncharacterized cupin superfamily protein